MERNLNILEYKGFVHNPYTDYAVEVEDLKRDLKDAIRNGKKVFETVVTFRHDRNMNLKYCLDLKEIMVNTIDNNSDIEIENLESLVDEQEIQKAQELINIWHEKHIGCIPELEQDGTISTKPLIAQIKEELRKSQ